MIAHLYGLTEEDFTHVLATFPVVDAAVKEAALAAYRALAPNLAEPQRTKSRTSRRPRSPEA